MKNKEGRIINVYDTMKIPRGTILKIDELIKISNQDFTSRTDVVKHAIRLLYNDMKKQ